MYSQKLPFSWWVTRVAVVQETARMGEAWGQPGVNRLDMGVETRWFVGTAYVRWWWGGGGHVDVDVDTCAARHVCRVRAHWVHVGGAGNVMVGSECVRWGRSECAGGRVVQMCESHSTHTSRADSPAPAVL